MISHFGKGGLYIDQKVIFNDFLYSNYVSYNAFFADGELDKERVQNFIKEMNNVDVSSLDDNYCSLNYGNKYFGMAAAKKIGYIRDEIERRKSEFSLKEYFVLVASLIYSADRIANTTGQFEAYLKNPEKFKNLEMGMVDAKCYTIADNTVACIMFLKILPNGIRPRCIETLQSHHTWTT